jgi:hypothetical protein
MAEIEADMGQNAVNPHRKPHAPRSFASQSNVADLKTRPPLGIARV